MNLKTDFRKGLMFILSLAGICFFILNSCGLETIYFLEPPEERYNDPTYESDEPNQYFIFRPTKKNSSDGTFRYLGTEVYYKIYNNVDTMKSRESVIDGLNSGTDETAAAERLIKSYNYQTFKTPNSVLSPLYANGESAGYVYIRLNEGSVEAYKSVIHICNSIINEYRNIQDASEKQFIPRRSINNDYGFEFSEDDDYNPIPKEGDEDVEWSSSTTEAGSWYIDLYAISVGRDTANFTPSYSKVLFLGSTKIEVK